MREEELRRRIRELKLLKAQIGLLYIAPEIVEKRIDTLREQLNP